MTPGRHEHGNGLDQDDDTADVLMALGKLMGEVSETNRRVDKLETKVDHLETSVGEAHGKLDHIAKAVDKLTPGSIPPMRAKVSSVSDFEEEITMSGRKVRLGTDEDVRQMVEARVHAVLRKRELEGAEKSLNENKATKKQIVMAVGLAIVTAIVSALIGGRVGIFH